MAKEYLVTDIKFDTDGEKVELPDSLKIVVPDDIQTQDEIEEFISDEISNMTGFCHKGFSTTPEIEDFKMCNKYPDSEALPDEDGKCSLCGGNCVDED